MRGRVTDKSSILLLGRNSVIIGAVVICVLSIGLGYLLGYKGNSLGRSEKLEDVSLPVPPTPSADKKAAEVPPVLPPIVDAAKAPVVQEPVPGKEQIPAAKEAPAAPVAKEPPPAKKEKLIEPPLVQAKEEPKAPAQTATKETKAASASEKAAASKKKKKAAAPSAKEEASDDAPSDGKAYAIQFGAFPSKQGAVQLQGILKDKGIKAYIMERTDGDPYYRVRTGSYKNRKEADKAAVALQKKTGLQNFVTSK